MKNLKYRLNLYHKGISIFLTRYAPKKYKSGFTLIELMVVISIIGLLSSIVLVAVKDAREKAEANAFRASVNQFINALELYRGDNDGKYPFEIYSTDTTGYSLFSLTNGNMETSYNTTGVLLSTVLSPKYLKVLPKVPTNSFTQSDVAYYYLVNSPVRVTTLYRCKGDIYTPKYVILFTHLSPIIYNIYLDLPIAEINQSAPLWGDSPNFKCFSLK